jgi:sugar phosphate isomerase/epimerase
MTKRIALQLYSVRELANQDYEGVVRKVAAMGYDGVETAGFPGTTAEAAAKLFKELGLTVTSAHVPLPLGENQQMVLETMEALGKPALVCTQIRPEDVKTMETIRALCDRLNQGYEVAKANDLAYGIHNHWWEFGEVDGRMVHHIMKDLLDTGIFFELDTYWIKVAGRDPAAIVESLGSRVPMLHIKDGPATHEDPMTAVGDGVMNIPAILKSAVPDVWQIVEMDRCATDILEATRKSYDYLSNLSY